uniref:Distal membrane-arm assembly complex protein 1-like domain-containing protein n=1 Tax=Podarcis muralis TaxID=64176 RepID=A0A670JMG4_PODMU
PALSPFPCKSMSSSVERAASSPEQKRSFFWSCFSCRALSGGALIASSLFVYSGPLRIMSHRIPPSMGNIAQMTFAVCKWGVCLSEPVGVDFRPYLASPRGHQLLLLLGKVKFLVLMVVN